MLRTFHIQNPIKQGADVSQLNISECSNGEKVIIGIADGERYAEIALNQQQFHELCDLRYTLDLTGVEPENQQQVETDQLKLRAA